MKVDLNFNLIPINYRAITILNAHFTLFGFLSSFLLFVHNFVYKCMPLV